MAVRSMTGFARAAGARGRLAWQWEVRSVNGRGLDVRLRLAPGFDALEGPIREVAARHLQRGSINIALSVTREAGAPDIRINEPALAQVVEAARRVRALMGDATVSADGLLAQRGVLEAVEPVEGEAEVEARSKEMLSSLVTALEGLVEARSAEGRRLSVVLAEQLSTVERLVDAAASSPSRAPDAIRHRLAEQLARILDAGTTLDPQRLHQEAALLAVRGDYEEEIKRLKAHVAAAREILAAAGPHGRKLDFLSQEFNREANTLCSKAVDIEVTRIGLDLKTVIDQMREQVQNLE